jgi:hypothetical protein
MSGKIFTYKTQKIASLFLALSLLYSCKVARVEMPSVGNPPQIIYSKEVVTNLSKTAIYEKMIKAIFALYPNSKLMADSKDGGQIEADASCKYTLKGKERRFNYRLSVTFSDKKCTLAIKNIWILHNPLEKVYFVNSSHRARQFNSGYADINDKANAMLEDLSKQLK